MDRDVSRISLALLGRRIFLPEISLGRHRAGLRTAAVRDLCGPLCWAPGAQTYGAAAEHGGNAVGQQPRQGTDGIIVS